MTGVDPGWYLALFKRLPTFLVVGIMVTTITKLLNRDVCKTLPEPEFDRKFELEFGGHGPTLGASLLGIICGVAVELLFIMFFVAVALLGLISPAEAINGSLYGVLLGGSVAYAAFLHSQSFIRSSRVYRGW